MKKILVSLMILFASMSAYASMIWRAIAVEPAQFEQLRKDPGALARALFAKGDQEISLDKDWHGIHFLLTGTAWKAKGDAGQAILGGREFGEDMGYGPPRVLSAAQVKVVAEALAKTSTETLSARFNPDAMTKAQIYPEVIWKREGVQALDSLLNSYSALAAFYKQSAERGQLVVIAMV